MKIMILAPYIYDKDMPVFSANKSGFGIMVNDIIKSIAEMENVIVLTRIITNGKEKHEGNYKLLSHTWRQILTSASVSDWCKAIKIFFVAQGCIRDKMKKMYYYLDGGYTRKCIKTFQPDIVHIHGINSITKRYIEICEEQKQKYVVTLHGLTGLSDSVRVSQEDKEIEKEFLSYADKNNRPVSVISTGVKRRIEQIYLKHSADNIVTVTNGTYIPQYDESSRTMYADGIKKQYHLSETCKICTVIGSVVERKNQLQIVEAFAELRDEVKKNCVIFMCGTDMMEGVVERRIQELGLESSIFMLGFLEHDEIINILKETDLNIVASLDEGFGLSIIEAYAYGVPTVTFADLDAINDLYNEDAMVLVRDRDTKKLAEGMEKALSREWNKEIIRAYSKKFSLENMAKKYVEFYQEILKMV